MNYQNSFKYLINFNRIDILRLKNQIEEFIFKLIYSTIFIILNFQNIMYMYSIMRREYILCHEVVLF